MGADHLDILETVGHGWMTGHQNKSPAAKKEACCPSCHESDCKPRAKTAGICHTITVTVAANQEKTGCVRTFSIQRAGAQRRKGPATTCTKSFGSPCKSGNAGVPSKINAGATAISRMCCIM